MSQNSDKGRAREAKGSVQEAIGKLIGDVLVEQQGASESRAGARDVDTADQAADRATGRLNSKVSPASDSSVRAKSGPADDDHGRKGGNV